MSHDAWDWYEVSLTYASAPNFRTYVQARSQDHAIVIAVLNATAKGWPREYHTVDVRA